MTATPATDTTVDRVVDDALDLVRAELVRAELVRADGKVSTLLTLATGGLAVLAAVAPGHTRTLPAVAVVAVWGVGVLLGLAVALSLLAISPRMPTGRGGPLPGTFAAYAAAATPRAVVDHARQVATAGLAHRAEQLQVLSRLVRIKYIGLRGACHALLAVLVLLTTGLVLALAATT